MRMGGGFRHGGFPRHRRFFGRGGAFFAPSGGGWGGYPWYWSDWDYPLYLIEDDEEREEARLFREQLTQQAAASAASAAASAAAAQAAAAQATKGKAMKGLGIFKPQDKTAHPLSEYGAVSGLGLGATTGPVPAECWSIQAFKDCQKRIFAKAQEQCPTTGYPNPAYDTYDDCVKDLAATFLGPSKEPVTCVSTYCPGKAAATGTPTGYPWNTYTVQTLSLQKLLNVELAKAGYCRISEDGKLGSGTCGALKALGKPTPSTCQKFSTPVKPPCPGAQIAPTEAKFVPGVTTAEMLPTPGAFNWKTAALVGAGVLAVGGIAYMLTRKRAE